MTLACILKCVELFLYINFGERVEVIVMMSETHWSCDGDWLRWLRRGGRWGDGVTPIGWKRGEVDLISSVLGDWVREEIKITERRTTRGTMYVSANRTNNCIFENLFHLMWEK
jgi:hypothetical protein